MNPRSLSRTPPTRLLAVALALASPTLQADEFSYKGLLTGERAAGLAGAYVGLSDDDTGMYYNPAGIVHSNPQGPSASVNILSGSQTDYDNVFGTTTWTRESVELVPGFFGSLKRFDWGALGFSVVTVDSVSEDQTDRFRNVTIGATTFDELRVHNDLSNRTYDLGLSAARVLTPEWSIGMSLYVRYRDENSSYLQRLSNASTTNPAFDRDVLLVTVQQDDTEIGVRPLLGAMYRSKVLSAGLAVSRQFALTRDYQYAYTAEVHLGENDPAQDPPPTAGFGFDIVDESDRSENAPWHVAAGLALFPSQNATISLQVDYHSRRRVSASDVPTGAPPRDLATKDVVDYALALEHRMSPQWLGRVGLYTSHANNDARQAAAFERREEVDVYGATLSLSRLTESRHWTAGFQVAGGSGEATLGDVGFGASTAGTVDAQKLRYNLFLSTSF